MKKDYLKPEMDVMEIAVESMIATSGEGEHDSTIPGGKDDGSGFSNDHRGSWGNLWD